MGAFPPLSVSAKYDRAGDDTSLSHPPLVFRYSLIKFEGHRYIIKRHTPCIPLNLWSILSNRHGDGIVVGDHTFFVAMIQNSKQTRTLVSSDVTLVLLCGAAPGDQSSSGDQTRQCSPLLIPTPHYLQ
jgi:hypothetical protein